MTVATEGFSNFSNVLPKRTISIIDTWTTGLPLPVDINMNPFYNPRLNTKDWNADCGKKPEKRVKLG